MEEEDEKESESLGLPSDPKKLALQIEQDAEESVVSSTSSSPSKCTEDTPELGFEPDVVNATKSTASDEQKKDLSPNAILLKVDCAYSYLFYFSNRFTGFIFTSGRL
jgi:hypothetical protein